MGSKDRFQVVHLPSWTSTPSWPLEPRFMTGSRRSPVAPTPGNNVEVPRFAHTLSSNSIFWKVIVRVPVPPAGPSPLATTCSDAIESSSPVTSAESRIVSPTQVAPPNVNVVVPANRKPPKLWMPHVPTRLPPAPEQHALSAAEGALPQDTPHVVAPCDVQVHCVVSHGSQFRAPAAPPGLCLLVGPIEPPTGAASASATPPF